MSLNILALTAETVAKPIEVVEFIGSPFDTLKSVAKTKDGFLLKPTKGQLPPTKVLTVWGFGKFYVFDVKSVKQGYAVDYPRGFEYMPDPSELMGLNLSRPRTYYAYEAEDLPEACKLRIDQAKIDSMAAIMENSSESELAKLFSLQDEDQADQLDKAAEILDSSDVAKDELLGAISLIKDNYALTKYSLAQGATDRQTVEAYFNMTPGLLKDMPVSIVTLIKETLDASLDNLEANRVAAQTLELVEDPDEVPGDSEGN